jgi:hypothetical protein
MTTTATVVVLANLMASSRGSTHASDAPPVLDKGDSGRQEEDEVKRSAFGWGLAGYDRSVVFLV